MSFKTKSNLFEKEEVELNIVNLAEVKANHAQKKFKDGKFMKSLILFTEAIVLDCNNCSYFLSRSNCLAELGQYDLTLADLLSALKIDNSPEISHKAFDWFIKLGAAKEAGEIIHRIEEIQINKTINEQSIKNYTKLKNLVSKIHTSFDCNEISTCLMQLNEVLEISTCNDAYKFLKIECLLILGRVTEAQKFFHSNFIAQRDQDYFEAFEYYYVKGDVAECIKKFKTIRHSVEIRDLLQQADNFTKDKNYDAAINVLNKALIEDPRNNAIQLKVLLEIGKIEMKLENHTKASFNFTRALQHDPQNKEALLLRAKAFLSANMIEECIFDCSIVHKLNLTEDEVAAVESLQSEIKTLKTTNLSEEKYEEGCKEYQKGKHETAKKLFSENINLDGNKSKYFIKRAQSLEELKDYQNALDEALQLVDIDSSCEEAYRILLNCCLKLGKTEIAYRFLKDRFLAAPELIELKDCEEKICGLFNCECYDECIRHIKKFKSIATECTRHDQVMAECLIRQNKFDEASNVIDAFLKIHHDNAEMIFLKGLNFYTAGKVTASIEYFENAIKLQKDFTKSLTFLEMAKSIIKYSNHGKISIQKSYFSDAEMAFSEVLKIDPTNKTVMTSGYSKRAYVRISLNNLKGAYDDLTEALKIDNLNKKALLHRAIVHGKLEEYENCIDDCEFYLKIESTSQVEDIKKISEQKLKSRPKIDSHKILGVPENASAEEIKKGYKSKSLLYHPDKHPNATELDIKKLKRMLIQVQTAYFSLISKLENNSSETNAKTKPAGSSSTSNAQSSSSSFRFSFCDGATRNENGFDFGRRFREATAPSFSNQSHGDGCKAMVYDRDLKCTRPCKRTNNCHQHRAENQCSSDSSSSFDFTPFKQTPKTQFSCDLQSFMQQSNSTFYSSSSRSSSGGGCNEMVYDRNLHGYRPCKNTINCHHHRYSNR